MNRRTRRQPPSHTSSPSYLRYLKPGALAQLRDSRISARSNRVDLPQHQQEPAAAQICSPGRSSSPAAGEVQPVQTGPLDGQSPPSPCFSGRICGLRFPQRKKLVAARAFYFAGPNLAGPGPEPDPIVDFFGSSDNNSHSNILVAH